MTSRINNNKLETFINLVEILWIGFYDKKYKSKVGQIYEVIYPTSTMWHHLLHYPVIKKSFFAQEQLYWLFETF